MEEKHLKAIATAVNEMAHSVVHNYATPGLTSSLIGGDGNGKVRLFSSDRYTWHWITPHSHRFNFTCLVLAGEVENVIFTKGFGEMYCASTLRSVAGGLGSYQLDRATGWSRWLAQATVYKAGETYSMRAEQVHSIRFSHDARVLFFEGPELFQTTTILEPWSNGKVVETFETASWMFQRVITGTDERTP